MPVRPHPVQLPLFVYGTLRPGQPGHRALLQQAVSRVRPASVIGRLYLYEPGGYPFLTTGTGVVRGELLDIEPDQWSELIGTIDEFEDYHPTDEIGSWYLRRRTEARMASGERVRAWVYYWNRPTETGRLLPNGDWRLFNP